MERSFHRALMRCAVVAFVALELLLFPMIQLTPGDVSTFSSYFAIAVITAFALLCYSGEADVWYVRCGVILTLVADTFLLLCDDKELFGVLTFIAVQLFYCIYLTGREPRRTVRTVSIVLRSALSVLLIGVAFIVLGRDTDLLAVASVVYYGLLVLNTVFAFMLGKGQRIFAIGLTLFCLCDLSIGLETLFDSYLGSDALAFFYGDYLNLPWVFYQPSQVLIALSIYLKARK